MSFHEISIAVRAENRASYAFRAIAMDVVHLGYSFGMLDSQTGRVISGIMSAVHLFLSLKAVLATATATQMAHNVAVGTGATVQTTLTGAIVGSTVAQGAQNVATTSFISLLTGAITALGAKVIALGSYIATTIGATSATMAFNVALAFKVGLLTLGVGVIIATAAAMALLAAQTNAVASAMHSAGAAAEGYTRGIQRAGEGNEALLRRGVD